MKKILTLLAIALAALTSCKPDEEEISPSEVYLNVYYDDIVFPSDGGEDSFEIESNGDWVITNDADWLTIDPSEGKGSCSITLTASASDLYDDRNTVITVKAGDKTETFTVTQKYAEALLVTKNKFDIPQEGGEFTVEVQSNISYDIVIDDDCQSWISEVPQSKALNTYTHTFSVESNQDTTKRDGSIEIIGSNGKTETINIYQAQKDELVLSKSEETVPAKGGEVRVQLRSNVDYEVIVPEDVDWVEQLQSDKADELVFNVKPNSETSTREAEITVKDKNSDLSQIFTIIQTPGSIVLDETYYEVPASGDTLDIVFTSDVEYEIIIGEDDASWITYEETESEDSYQHNLRIFVGPNTVNEIRAAEIDIKDKNSDIKATVTVRQLTGDIILEDSWIEADASGETIRVPFATDIEYEVNIPEEYSSWISLVSAVQTKALIDTAFSLKIEPNATGSRREARIAVKDKYSDLSQTLTIEQYYMKIGVDGKSYTVPARGETLTIRTASANIEYNVIVPEEFSSWISVPEDDDSTSFKLKIEPNDDIKVRNATINLSDVNGLISEKISIQQEIAEMSLVNRDSSILNSFNTTLTISVASNVETELIIPNDAKSWIQDETDTTKLSSDIKTFTVNILKNESLTENRETEVILKDKYSPMQLKYYIFQYNNSEYHGDIVFTSVEQLKKHSEYKQVYGNVTFKNIETLQALNNQLIEIYGNVSIDNVRSLDGLYGLTRINGDLTEISDVLLSFEGLNNLETVEGNFEADNISFESLKSLTAIGGNLTVSNIESFVGLENLSEIGGGTLSLDNVTSCRGLSGIKSLQYILASHITSFEGLNNLNTIYNDFNVSVSDIVNFNGLGGLQSIGGDFILSYGFNKLTSFIGLEQLQTIGGDFIIRASSTLYSDVNYYQNFGMLQSFEGLNNLTTINGSFIIDARACARGTNNSFAESMNALMSFNGLSNLSKIGGDFEINAYASTLTDKYVDNASALCSLQSLDGLNSLQEVGKNFIIKNTGIRTRQNLTSLDFSRGPQKLSLINGDFIIESCGKGYLSGFSGLRTINGDFVINGIRSECSGLDNLQQISGNLSIIQTEASIIGMNKLQKVGGNIKISDNSELECIYGFSDLTNCTNISITNSPNLYNFQSLETAAKNMTGTWYVNGCGYNPTKYQMLNGESKPQE